MISIATGIFGFILIVSLLAIVRFLSLKLRRVTASIEINSLLYIKKEVADLEEKKDMLRREAANIISRTACHLGKLELITCCQTQSNLERIELICHIEGKLRMKMHNDYQE